MKRREIDPQGLSGFTVRLKPSRERDKRNPTIAGIQLAEDAETKGREAVGDMRQTVGSTCRLMDLPAEVSWRVG